VTGEEPPLMPGAGDGPIVSDDQPLDEDD
jgi:hypothetical protein